MELADAAGTGADADDPASANRCGGAPHQMTIIVGMPLRSGPGAAYRRLDLSPQRRGGCLYYNICTARNNNGSCPGNGGTLAGNTSAIASRWLSALTPTRPRKRYRAGGCTDGAAGAGIWLVTRKTALRWQAMPGRYGMVTLMANHAAPTEAGSRRSRSAIWDETGALLVAAPDDAPLVLSSPTGPAICWHGRQRLSRSLTATRRKACDVTRNR